MNEHEPPPRAFDSNAPLAPMDRDYLLRNVVNDTRQALDCMVEGDWLRADILLKLAVDQLADTGLIP